jgi:hypothetical protein
MNGTPWKMCGFFSAKDQAKWKERMLAERAIRRAECEKNAEDSFTRAEKMLPPAVPIEYRKSLIVVPLKGLYIKAADEDRKG